LLVCDNTVFVKMLPCLDALMPDAEKGHPYSGAKEHYILDIDNAELSREVVAVLEPVIPLPKSRKKKTESPANGNELLASLEKLRTTELGVLRIKQNLGLTDDDVVAWCKEKTILADKIIHKGKNWYVYAGDAVITINAHSYTIITAHKQIVRK